MLLLLHNPGWQFEKNENGVGPMDDQSLVEIWHGVLPIPSGIWQKVVKNGANLGFIDADHHRVRNLVVEALPKQGKAVSMPCWRKASTLPGLYRAHCLDLTPDWLLLHDKSAQC
jgi:hypothetical protein